MPLPYPMLGLRVSASAGVDDRGARIWLDPQVQLEETPRPVPGFGEAIVRVAYCGICGSDFSIMSKGQGGRISYRGIFSPPVILGHEFSGWVERSQAWPTGGLVVGEETYGCADCPPCLGGREELCLHPEKIGFNRDGAFAPYVRVPDRKLWSIGEVASTYGEDLALKLGALVQPYAVAWSVFYPDEGRNLGPGESILFFGAGPLALCGVDLSGIRGVRRVEVCDYNSERSGLAGALGARPAIHSGSEDRFSWIVDSTGSRDLLPILRDRMAPAGHLVLLHRAPEFSVQDLSDCLPAGCTVSRPDGHGRRRAFPEIISMMADRQLHGELLIDRVIGLPEAKELLRLRSPSRAKVLVNPALRV